MRVAEDKLVAKAVAHVGDVEVARFLPNLCIEAHVQQHVAEFLARLRLVAAHERVAEFISFFNRIGAQAFVGLLTVPRAFLSQFVEHVEQPAESFKFFFACVHDIYYCME